MQSHVRFGRQFHSRILGESEFDFYSPKPQAGQTPKTLTYSFGIPPKPLTFNLRRMIFAVSKRAQAD
jgi:hypothetical protein